MKKLNIEKTHLTPEIHLDAKNGQLQFLGRSLPENPNRFFEPISDWMVQYLKNPAPKTKLTFDLSYMNTGTTRYIFDSLKRAEKLTKAPYHVSVEWICHEYDEDMMETGEILQTMTTVPFHFSMRKAS